MFRSAGAGGRQVPVTIETGTPTCVATGVQMSASTPGASIRDDEGVAGALVAAIRFGCSFHQPLAGTTPMTAPPSVRREG